MGLLPVKEDLDLEHKVGSSEANGLMNFETEDLETYQNQFQDLELHLERTISSYQCHILTLESKTLDDCLRAQEVEQNFIIARQEAADMKQRIRETSIQFHLLEVDPQVLNNLSGAFGRKNCFPNLCAQNGDSSEMRGPWPIYSDPPLDCPPFNPPPLSPSPSFCSSHLFSPTRC